MESEFLNRYGNEDNFDEDEMTKDVMILMLQISFKEKRINKMLQECENEKSIDVFMEYCQKRKELAEEYIEKMKQTENNYGNDTGKY